MSARRVALLQALLSSQAWVDGLIRHAYGLTEPRDSVRQVMAQKVITQYRLHKARKDQADMPYYISFIWLMSYMDDYEKAYGSEP